MKKRLRKALETMAVSLAVRALILNEWRDVEHGGDLDDVLNAARMAEVAARIADVLERSPGCYAGPLVAGEPLSSIEKCKCGCGTYVYASSVEDVSEAVEDGLREAGIVL